MIMFGIYKFYFQAFHFLIIRRLYNLNFFAQNHYILHILVISTATSVLCLFPQKQFLPLIFLGSMILYTALFRPHSETKNNVRSIANYFAMCTFVAFKCYAQTLSAQKLSNDDTLFLIFGLIILSFVTVIVSFVFHALHFMKAKKKE